MISAHELVSEFKKKLYTRKTDRGFAKDLQVEDICSYLNEAQRLYFENRAAISETNDVVTYELAPLEKIEVVLKPRLLGKVFSTIPLPKDYYKTNRRRAKAESKQCGQKILTLIPFQSNDLNKGLKNPFWKPDFAWEQTICKESSDGLLVWHNGEFKILEVVIDYYRTPTAIHAPSLKAIGEFYESYDGKKITKDAGCELAGRAPYKIVDLAVVMAFRDLGDAQDFQTQMTKILSLEKSNS